MSTDTAAEGPSPPAPPPAPPRRRIALNTAIFALATAFSRVAGLIREVVAAGYFGTSKYGSAFTVASQIPNLMANLFAQAALSAAFVPVFSDLLQQGQRRKAFALASTLFWIILIGLGALTAVGILASGLILPLFTGANFDGGVAATLTQIMFPVVLVLGLTGLLVGILQTYDEFTVAALAPVAWNLVILVLLVVLHSHFGHDGINAYAIAWLVATVVQGLLVGSALRRIDFRLGWKLDWRDPLVRRVFALMLPVTLGLGIVNLDALINSSFGALVNTHPAGAGPRAIQLAFLIYMLPQGVFSVAVSTVLFPTLSRQAARRAPAEMRTTLGVGMRQITLLLVPAAAGMIALATPIVRLVFQHGQFGPASTHYTSIALFWFAWSLPFAGLNLLLTRTFFALQRPWIPTKLAAINMAVDIVLSIGLYKPLGIAGLVIGTAVANVVMTGLQIRRLRTGFNGRLDLDQTVMIAVRILLAAAITGVIAWVVHRLADSVLGHGSVPGQVVAVGLAVAVAGAFYARAVTVMRIPEARQIQDLVLARLGRAQPR
ncbi:MAG TPA: murein biosynthesis integral membrane protein MurJ [Solirubrobacteraceae bacterium]|nr:murein biosynthesis integral membrane protein MurJ [Solirubrobacteraceae bacterium]